jgi:hypothetical protein
MYPPDRHPLDEELQGGVVLNPHTEYARELRKWEMFPSHLTPPGTRPGNPFVQRDYPLMLYRATMHPRTGKGECLLPLPNAYDFDPGRMDLYDQAINAVMSWNREHQNVVPDAAARAVAEGQGWCLTPAAAVARYEQTQLEIANAAAEAAHRAARMSPPAQREYTEASAETSAHVVDVQPRRKRSHRRKPRAIAPADPDARPED